MTQLEHSVEYQAYLIKLAETNIAKGVIEEPRIYTQTFDLTDENDAARSDPLTFVNGEKFPVRILYMTANATSVVNNASYGLYGERVIQAVGLRLRFHDQFYMRPDFVPFANWATQVNSSSDVNNLYTSSHKCWRPVVLSTRDSFEVRVRPVLGAFGGGALDPSEDAPWRVTVTFTGVGLFSKRPYFLTGYTDLTGFGTITIPVGNYKNDGAEPILVTDITHSAVQRSVAGDVQNSVAPFVSLGVRQIGNGTNASWVVSAPGVDTLAPLPLWGTYSGRALVHRFPGQGLIWEPGEGLEVAVRQQALLSTTNVALVGYIAVQ